MNFLQRFRAAVNYFANEIAKNPNKTEYTHDEVLNLYNNSQFRNPFKDTIRCWEMANKPKRLRVKY